jgi:hypothetical protein
LEESLRDATIYVGGDKVPISSKDVSARIREAIGKLVDDVYHKLTYIDKATNEVDVRKLLQDNGQQLMLEGTESNANALALRDVLDYISIKTRQHLKISMKAITQRFTDKPYGFIEADVQWLVAKLFKTGDISLYVNSEPVTLHSNSVSDIVRYLTRKEYVEKLLIEKHEKATEKQEKAVRIVMKELFDSTPIGNDDEAMMSSFVNCAKNLKEDLERLETYYQTQPKYPGRSIVTSGKVLLLDVLQIRQSTEFFKKVDKEQDDYLDFAEDYYHIRNFFASEQVRIWDKALHLMGIYRDSATYIVNAEIEKVVFQIEAIMRKKEPYSEIFKIPSLLDTYRNIYTEELEKIAEPVMAAIEDASKRVSDERAGKRCENQLKDNQSGRFEQLREKAEHCNNVAVLQSIKVEADALKIRCLNEIHDTEDRLIQAEQEQAKQAATKTNAKRQEVPAAQPQPLQSQPKKRKTVSIRSINTSTTWQVETSEDVRCYMAELEQKLLEQLEQNTIVNIEF